MKILIANAFSLSMLDRDAQRNNPGDPVYPNPRIPRPCDDPADFIAVWEAAGAEIESVVGHADTAALFSVILGRPVAVNRASVKLDYSHRTVVLVGQYIGRLPTGATTLPEGATFEWWTV